MKISVTYIALNEEQNIAHSLDSVQGLADEIIVIDSGSTDATREIARKYGAKIIEQDWLGFTAQKNIALEHCTGTWVLSLDCDEVLTDELKLSIQKATDSDQNGWYIKRKTVYMDKILNHAWQPDKKLRLVRRSSNPQWKGEDVHEYLNVEGETAVLDGYLLHYSYSSFKDHMTRTIKYAELSANSYYKRGKKSSMFKILIRPLFTFFNKLILKRAFLDGVPGLMSAFSSSFYVYMKYSYLWEKTKEKATR